MNELVKKLYKKARFRENKKAIVCTSAWDGCTELVPCEKCSLHDKVPTSLPSFLEYKQLELFKLLMRHEKTELYCRYINGTYRILVYTEDCCADAIEESFEEALASVTCDIWGLLSKEEKKEVKRILN